MGLLFFNAINVNFILTEAFRVRESRGEVHKAMIMLKEKEGRATMRKVNGGCTHKGRDDVDVKDDGEGRRAEMMLTLKMTAKAKGLG